MSSCLFSGSGSQRSIQDCPGKPRTTVKYAISLQCWTLWNHPHQTPTATLALESERALVTWRAAHADTTVCHISVYSIFMHVARFSQRTAEQHLFVLQSQLLWAIRTIQNHAHHSSLYFTSERPKRVLWIKGKSTELFSCDAVAIGQKKLDFIFADYPYPWNSPCYVEQFIESNSGFPPFSKVHTQICTCKRKQDKTEHFDHKTFQSNIRLSSQATQRRYGNICRHHIQFLDKTIREIQFWGIISTPILVFKYIFPLPILFSTFHSRSNTIIKEIYFEVFLYWDTFLVLENNMMAMISNGSSGKVYTTIEHIWKEMRNWIKSLFYFRIFMTIF